LAATSLQSVTISHERHRRDRKKTKSVLSPHTPEPLEEEEEEEEEEFFDHYKNDLERHAHTPSLPDANPGAR